jgi:hypothetical protein
MRRTGPMEAGLGTGQPYRPRGLATAAFLTCVTATSEKQLKRPS